MNVLLDSMVDPENVQKAWRRVRRDRAPWSPEVNREHLEQALPRHLLRLVQDLQTGRYRPGAMRQFAVAKGDGGRRVISAQYLRDKLAQRMAHQVLEPRVEPFLHPDSFGYRPGRGVPHALHRVRERIATGLDWVVDADIRSFFDQVPHRGVRRELKRFVRDRGFRRLIDRWLVAGSHSASLAGPRRGVPQGAVLSPLLCNIFLDRLDRSLADAGIPFVRYADDFLLLAATRTDAERARSHVDRRLRRMGLELHPDKTRVSRVSPRVRFLGEPVVRRSRATRKRRQ